MTPNTAHQNAPPLPELRDDLQLVGMTVDAAGEQLWKIYDPMRHRFTAIGRCAFAMLDGWRGATRVEQVVEAAWARHSEVVSVDDVLEFAKFLLASGLANSRDPKAWRQDLAAAEDHRKSYFTRLLHNYLFFRIPFCDPELFLRRTMPMARMVVTRAGAVVVLGIIILGLYLLSREWDTFLASAIGLSSPSAVFGLGIALFVVKIVHELAHGYAAVHYGARVPTLGVAFILGVPLLFVDVTDSWRLKSKRARLIIDSAGIAADISISLIATFAWSFLPPGALRDVMFFLATAGWIASLAFNLNPFMKFDGYHIVSDALSMPNLQDRALEFARWRLRECLFGLGHPTPEAATARMTRGLVWYGASLWFYRLILFTGIAIAVYLYFFKLLGLILFAVEIGYFIAVPVYREIKQWVFMRSSIRATRRSMTTLGLLLILFVVLVVPWSTAITVPAMLEPSDVARLHTPTPARVVELDVDPTRQRRLAAFDRLARLESPQLEHELKIARLKAAVIDVRLGRLASDATDREQATVLLQERRTIEQTISGIEQKNAALVVVVPTHGSLASLADYMRVGRWISPSEPIALIHGEGGGRVRGLVESSDRSRMKVGMQARFIPQDLTSPSLMTVITSIAAANAAAIDQLELAEPFGGPVQVTVGPDNLAVPLTSVHAVTATLDAAAQMRLGANPRPQVGILLVYGQAESLLSRFWNRVLMVLVRESGF